MPDWLRAAARQRPQRRRKRLARSRGSSGQQQRRQWLEAARGLAGGVAVFEEDGVVLADGLGVGVVGAEGGLTDSQAVQIEGLGFFVTTLSAVQVKLSERIAPPDGLQNRA